MGLNRYVARSHLSEARFRQIVRLFAMDLEATKVSALTGVSRRTVNRVCHALRVRMARECERQAPLGGRVEIDESYFGPRRVRGKGGRGAGRKTIVFGIFKRNGRVYTRIVPNVQKATLQAVIRGKLNPASVVHSDGWSGYDGLVDLGYRKHFSRRASAPRIRRAAAGQPHQRDRKLLEYGQDAAGAAPRPATHALLLASEGVRVPLQSSPPKSLSGTLGAGPKRPSKVILSLPHCLIASLPH